MMINKRLIQVCEESKKYMIYTVIASWTGSLCNIGIILLVGQFINKMVSKEGIDAFSSASVLGVLTKVQVTQHLSLLSSILIIACLLVIKFIAHHQYGRNSYKASANARVKLRELLYEKLLRLGMTYQETQKTSAVVQVAIEGIEQLEIYFGRYLPQFFYAMLAPLTLFVVISFISFKAAIVFMLCVPLIPISIITIMKLAKRILKEYWNNYANLGDRFLENLQGLTTLKVFDQDEMKHQEMNEEAERFRKITMKVLSMQLNSINIMDLIAFGGSAVGTIVALYEFKNGQLGVGDLIVIILLSSEFFIPLRLLGSYFHIAMNGMAASDRIFEILDTEEPVKGTKSVFKQDQAIDVSIRNATFSYDSQKDALKDISMEMKPGHVTAIVGESGSGKSTLASLLMAQHELSSGEILFNGVSIKDIDPVNLYSHVGLVSAHSHIFKGTIRENLLVAAPNATSNELSLALSTARLDEFVALLPHGLDTIVLENGSNLSGGQKQRLALARLILANRQMIIFDEATSNIDVESEEAIWEAIYELGKTKTIVVISHRLASVRDANQIYVLNSGELLESGIHEQLMSATGKYAEMVGYQAALETIREVK
ncbi:MAG TPA: cysteine ABC transporter ATP-binding protein [Firmicutes bacterium]|nr:cysteine ABC transporter ATP-binding protein [Bacillota bacterium]